MSWKSQTGQRKNVLITSLWKTCLAKLTLKVEVVPTDGLLITSGTNWHWDPANGFAINLKQEQTTKENNNRLRPDGHMERQVIGLDKAERHQGLVCSMVAEYVVTHIIAHEPASHWWVQNVLQKRNFIVSKAKSKLEQCTSLVSRYQRQLKRHCKLTTRQMPFYRNALARELSKVKVAWKLTIDNYTPTHQVRQ